MLAQVWPFLEDKPPVMVDWLPWNHTFGGNHNFNLVLRNGGTLYIDGGKPAPGLIDDDRAQPARGLADDLLQRAARLRPAAAAPRERRGPAAQRSSATSTSLFYAAAALPQNLWERLEALAMAENGGAPGDALGLGLHRDRRRSPRWCTSRSSAPA